MKYFIAALVILTLAWIGHDLGEHQKELERKHAIALEQNEHSLNVRVSAAQVEGIADFLHAQVVEGKYDKVIIYVDDQWGQRLRVKYSINSLIERIIVQSIGPDGVADTMDDLYAYRSHWIK